MNETLNESMKDALVEVIKAAGGSKTVGLLMRPELDADDAGGWLRNCLDTDRREKLSLAQFLLILKLGRQHACHAAMSFLANDVGYTTAPIKVEDEAAELMREFIAAQRSVSKVAEKLERAGLLKAVA